MQLEGSLPCLQEHVCGPCPERYDASPHLHSHFSKIHSNIILLSTPRTSK